MLFEPDLAGVVLAEVLALEVEVEGPGTAFALVLLLALTLIGSEGLGLTAVAVVGVVVGGVVEVAEVTMLVIDTEGRAIGAMGVGRPIGPGPPNPTPASTPTPSPMLCDILLATCVCAGNIPMGMGVEADFDGGPMGPIGAGVREEEGGLLAGGSNGLAKPPLRLPDALGNMRGKAEGARPLACAEFEFVAVVAVAETLALVLFVGTEAEAELGPAAAAPNPNDDVAVEAEAEAG